MELRLLSIWDEALLLGRRDVIQGPHIEATAPPRLERDFAELLRGSRIGR